MILNYVLITLYIILWALNGIIFISIILSWIPPVLNTKVGLMIREVSNWMLYPFRGWLAFGFFDFTTIIGLVLLQFIMRIFEQLIF